MTKYVKELILSSGTKTAGVVGRLHLKITFSLDITLKPSNKYLTLKAISNWSKSKFTGTNSLAFPISWASALTNARSFLFNLILTTLLCWSAKTAILSSDSIIFFVLNVKSFVKLSGINWE